MVAKTSSKSLEVEIHLIRLPQESFGEALSVGYENYISVETTFYWRAGILEDDVDGA